MYEYEYVCAIVHMCGSRDNFMELLLCFHIYVGSEDQIQVTRLMQQTPFRLNISPYSFPTIAEAMPFCTYPVEAESWPAAQ